MNEVENTPITKPVVQKHPGRIAAGKKLVEWNRKQKEKLKAASQEPIASSSQEPIASTSQEVISSSSSYQEYFFIATGGLLIAAYYLYKQSDKKPTNDEIKESVIEKNEQRIFFSD